MKQMKKFCFLAFLFAWILYLCEGYLCAQPVSVSEGRSYQVVSNNNGSHGDLTDEEEPAYIHEEITPIWDPLGSYNRVIFAFNDKLYFYALKPLSNGYKAVVPERARVSIRNFYSNTSMPMRFINCLLQGKLKKAGTETLRLVINTTIGIGGLFDPAKSLFHLEMQEEDFGQTLGRFGMGPGFYIELPFLGPSNFRDTLGLGGDVAADPFTYLIGPWERFGARSVDTINELSLDQDTYESIIEPAVDPYIAVQDAYIQNRNKKIKE